MKTRAIDDEPRLSQLRSGTADLVKRTAQGRFALSKEEGWVAVPVRGVAHFGEENVRRIHDAWEQSACSVAFAVLLEPLRGLSEVSEVDTSIDGIKAFDREFAHFNVALTTFVPKEAVIVCTTDDYFVVAGSEEFVTLAVGCPISEAYARFDAFASGAGWSEGETAFFRSILSALRDKYSTLPRGASVTFPLETLQRDLAR